TWPARWPVSGSRSRGRSMAIKTLAREVTRLRRLHQKANRPTPATGSGPDPTAYPDDPCGYAASILRVTWWAKQQEVARAGVEHPRGFVKASHGVGKTHLAGGLISWHFDSFDPSISLSTAPTAAQLHDLTWREVRVQRKGPGMLPKAPRIEGRFP